MLFQSTKLKDGDEALAGPIAKLILMIDASLLDGASSDDTPESSLLHLRAIAAKSYVMRCKDSSGESTLWASSLRILRRFPSSIHANESAASLLLKTSAGVDVSSFSECVDLLLPNLR